MRHGQNARLNRARDYDPPFAYRIGQVFAAHVPQVISLSILANSEDQLNLRHLGQDPRAPMGGAFAPWRQIAAVLVITWKAEAHRHDGEACRIIELVAID